jgi:hypothetical protein
MTQTSYQSRPAGATEAPSGEKGGADMAALTTTQAEADVRDFARQFPTPAVRRALALCEAGTLPWEAVAGLAREALAKALATV